MLNHFKSSRLFLLNNRTFSSIIKPFHLKQLVPLYLQSFSKNVKADLQSNINKYYDQIQKLPTTLTLSTTSVYDHFVKDVRNDPWLSMLSRMNLDTYYQIYGCPIIHNNVKSVDELKDILKRLDKYQRLFASQISSQKIFDPTNEEHIKNNINLYIAFLDMCVKNNSITNNSITPTLAEDFIRNSHMLDDEYYSDMIRIFGKSVNHIIDENVLNIHSSTVIRSNYYNSLKQSNIDANFLRIIADNNNTKY